jgi:hypothetical protein
MRLDVLPWLLTKGMVKSSVLAGPSFSSAKSESSGLLVECLVDM